jgi:hypothetical protein
MLKHTTLLAMLMLGISQSSHGATYSTKNIAQTKQITQKATATAPQVPNLADIERYLPSDDIIGQTADNFKVDFSYIPTQQDQIYYFDKAGKYSQTPDPKGHYRKVLGKMPDGRLVVQDFFQDTHTAQSSLIILKSNAGLKSFDAKHDDNNVTTFDRQGNTITYKAFSTDKSTFYHFILKDKQVIGFYHDDKIHLYYPKTHKLMAIAKSGKNSNVTFYYETGELWATHDKLIWDKSKNLTIWDKQGNYPPIDDIDEQGLLEAMDTVKECLKFIIINRL